jgi:RHS repeat-associated protein
LNTIAERSSDTTRSNDYAFGPGIDEPLARRASDGSIAYYLVDGLGSVVALTSATGEVTSTATYDEFGVTSSVDFFGYTGREFASSAFNLWNYRARYYRADWGRFISEDPLSPTTTLRVGLSVPSSPPDPAAVGARMHLYAYAQNSPILYKDPSGMKACLVFAITKNAGYLPVGPPGKTFKGCQYIGECGGYLSVYDVNVDPIPNPPAFCPCKDMCIVNIDPATGIPIGPSICFNAPPLFYTPPMPPLFFK